MSRKNKQQPVLEGITITDVAAEGKALARVDDCVVFVPYAVPGDVVDLQVTRKKHKYMEARVLRIITPSPLRIAPPCPHFGICGGCKWQILPYEELLKHKQRQVFDNLTRIGHIELPEIMPILGSRNVYAYRNKLEFTFSNRKWRTWEDIQERGELTEPADIYGLGFHIPTAFDKVLDISQCLLMDDINNRIRNHIRRFAIQHGMTFFNLRTQEGLLRNLIVRNSNKGELMLIVVFGQDDKASREMLMADIASAFPEITSLLYVVNTKCNDVIADLPVHVYRGRDYIEATMEDLKFKIGPKSFYQTNTDQALELYRVVRKFACLEGDELMFDLYTGTGTIANFLARRARQVIGIEYVPEAIDDARINASLNHLDNTLFYAGDMKDVLTPAFIERHGRPDVIITDPPRAGMHEDVVRTILSAAPNRIVYVSCNPATQARDLQLMDEKYRVTAVQPVDMFPHTHHVENVVCLELR